MSILPNGKRLQGAAAARRRVRSRTSVLQVPGNAADAVPCERLRNTHPFPSATKAPAGWDRVWELVVAAAHQKADSGPPGRQSVSGGGRWQETVGNVSATAANPCDGSKIGPIYLSTKLDPVSPRRNDFTRLYRMAQALLSIQLRRFGQCAQAGLLQNELDSLIKTQSGIFRFGQSSCVAPTRPPRIGVPRSKTIYMLGLSNHPSWSTNVACSIGCRPVATTGPWQIDKRDRKSWPPARGK